MEHFVRSGFLINLLIHVLIGINICYAEPKMSDTMKKMKAVKDKVLEGYDRFIRPTKEGSNTTEVRAGIMPRQVIEVDEARGLFILDSYFWMMWEDPRLKWDGSLDYDGWLPLSSSLLWLPDISVHNSHSLAVDPTNQVPLTISKSGHIFWVPPIQTQTSCPGIMEASYPDGEVECKVALGSWVHDGWEVDYSTSDYVHMKLFQNINPKWEVVEAKVRIVRNETYYDNYEPPIISVVTFFPMKRRPIPEIEATRNPCILVMLLTLSIFWLPPSSSKKIIVLGFMSLTLTVMIVYVAWSTSFPLAVLFAVSFLQSTLYIVVSSFLLQVLVIYNICNLSGPARPPPAAMQLLNGPFGKYACLKWSQDDNNIPIDRMQLKEDGPDISNSPTPADDWKLFAAGLDRLFFVLMSIAMIAIHHL